MNHVQLRFSVCNPVSSLSARPICSPPVGPNSFPATRVTIKYNTTPVLSIPPTSKTITTSLTTTTHQTNNKTNRNTMNHVQLRSSVCNPVSNLSARPICSPPVAPKSFPATRVTITSHTQHPSSQPPPHISTNHALPQQNENNKKHNNTKQTTP